MPISLGGDVGVIHWTRWVVAGLRHAVGHRFVIQWRWMKCENGTASLGVDHEVRLVRLFQ